LFLMNTLRCWGVKLTPGDLSQDESTGAYVTARTPFPRLGEPRDVAAAVAFLASDDASYISGAQLMVDGGWMAY
jgi:NAD(P)-dependent dehydrogenase (short-subunit alcohol dehydrogenase family)